LILNAKNLTYPGEVFYLFDIAKLSPKKRPIHKCEWVFEEGGDILSHRMAVPSALVGLTSLFGMGKLTHQKDANICSNTLNNLFN